MKNPHIKQFLLVQSGGFWLVTIIFVPLYSFLTISEAAFLDLGCIFPRWDGLVSLEKLFRKQRGSFALDHSAA